MLFCTVFIDLYQIHRPDSDTPIEETLRAMDDLVSSGKVRYIGCSNFSGWQLVESYWVSELKNLEYFISAQNRYSILSRNIELDLIPAAAKYGIGILPFFPLESGLLTGKYIMGKVPAKGTRWSAWKGRGPIADAFFSDSRFKLVNKLESICKKYNHSLIELAFGWLLDNPSVSSVIAGATKPSQIKQNVIAGQFRPNQKEKEYIDELTQPNNSPGMPRR